jgi:hypothetical protein
MGIYGFVAIDAVKLFTSGITNNPREAWLAAAEKNTNSESVRKKGCPQSTFLGLCEEGKVIGIPPGPYTKSIKNKNYALKALEVLNNNPNISSDELWVLVGKGIHNRQMDVVIALWNNKLLSSLYSVEPSNDKDITTQELDRPKNINER